MASLDLGAASALWRDGVSELVDAVREGGMWPAGKNKLFELFDRDLWHRREFPRSIVLSGKCL